MNIGKKLLLIASVLVATILVVSETKNATAFVDPHENGKVEICHATSANDNPYVSNEPDIGNNGDLSGGHLNHTGGVYPAANWGDIIPPYNYWVYEQTGTHYEYAFKKINGKCPNGYEDYGNPLLCRKEVPTYDWVQKNFAGQNWTPEGQTIYRNNCNIPKPSPSPSPSPSPTPTPTPTPTPSVSPKPSPVPSPSPNGCSTPDTDKRGLVAEEPECFEELVLEPLCKLQNGNHTYRITNPNDYDLDVLLEFLNQPEHNAIETVPANGEFIYEAPAGATGSLYMTYYPYPNGEGDKQQVVMKQPTNSCNQPSPTPTSQPNPSPEPQTNNLNVTFSCQTRKWNAEVVLRKNDKPVQNAKIVYQYYGKEDTRFTDVDGRNNFPFDDNGKGKLKLYIDSFNGHEVELNPPACEGTEPQSATAKKPMFANTGSAKTQIAFVLSVLAAVVVFSL